MLNDLRLRLRSLFKKGTVEDDLSDELRFHFDQQVEKLIQSGLPLAEARRRARLTIGTADQIQEEYRDSSGVSFFETLLQDIRFALRMLRKSPGFAAIAILTLALGIGANTALFSVVNGVLLNPLPYPHPEQLTSVYARSASTTQGYVTYLNFLDWQRDNKTFSSMAMYRNQDYNFTGNGPAERVSGMMVSADFFQTLAVKPILGRFFRADDDHIGAAPVVILGNGFWRLRFSASPSVIGKSIALQGASYTVVGVLPPNFTFYGPPRDVYTPLGQWSDPSFRDRRIDMSAHSFGRLKSGVALAQAQADMNDVARNLAVAFPDADKDVGIRLVSMKQDLVGSVQSSLFVLLGAVGFLLLIACANVANLILARSMARSREFAVRSALGAGHARVIRQLLTESILLGVVGGALGLLLAVVGNKVALSAIPAALPRANDISLDSRVLIFTLAVSLFAGILFGLAPALKTSRVNLQQVLNESGRGSSGARHRLHAILVPAEVALALVLLVGAGLMLRSLAALWAVNPGFNPNHAITFNLGLPSNAQTTSAETRARLRAFDARMRAIPGVEAVSITTGSRPMIHDTVLPFWIQGQPKPQHLNDMPQGLCYLVEFGFQKAMGVTLERGRFISDDDNEHSPTVIVIDDVFARTFFPHENPIGKSVNIALFNEQAKIVGVVGHIKQWGPGADPKIANVPQFELPFMQLPETMMPLVADADSVVLRTKADPSAIMPQVRRAVAELDPREVIYSVQTLDDVLSNSLAARRLSMILLAIFGALALLLACIGIYGVISYLVSQRTHEIGVRMALGAQQRDVLRLILGEGMRMAFLGVVIGVIAALGLTRLMKSMLFSVSASDPATFLGVAVILMIVAVAACYFPARRAMRVDPMVALRYE